MTTRGDNFPEKFPGPARAQLHRERVKRDEEKLSQDAEN
jgi:hypothetical protein